MWTAAVLSQIALAPIAGALNAALGAGVALGINAASFVLSGVLLAGLRVPVAVRSTKHRGFFVDAMAGLRVLAADRLLRAHGPGSSSPRYRPARRPRCWWCWPASTSSYHRPATFSCSAQSASAPRSVRCC